jgi:NAD(P)-dependent dehydrogenase (short-subunit alcohol dehydrogenase family)
MPNIASGRVANVLDLHGPNFVVGAGHRSLHEALTTAARLLEAGTCDLVLAGAIQAFAGSEADRETSFHRARGERPLGEATLVLALSRSGHAAQGLVPPPVALTLDDEPGGLDVMVGSGGAPYLWSAEGAHELYVAVTQARAGGVGGTIRWDGRAGPAVGVRPVPAVRPAPQGIRGPETPIHIAVPMAVVAPAVRAPLWVPVEHRLLVVADQEDWVGRPDVRDCLRARNAVVVCSSARPCDGAVHVDLSSEAAAAASMERLGPEAFDAVVLVKWLGRADPIDVLAHETRDGQGSIDVLFAIARRIYARLERGDARLGTLCLDGTGPAGLHAFTGLPSGFAKALARELPAACIKAVATDTPDLDVGLRQLELEWSQGHDSIAVDIHYRDGERYRLELARQDALSTPGTPWLSADSLVLLTGGARGVTAVLAEEILRRHGCDVVVVGRTDLRQFPEAVLSMSDDEFEAFEPAFYRDERRRDERRPMVDLKRVFESYRAAREVRDTLACLQALPGRVEYHVADVTSADEVDRLLARCAGRGRHLDLVVHGAAQQASRALVKKSMREFHQIIATKVSGTVNLERSCRQYFQRPVRHHLLTSAFSFYGNDGQPDYGAANEALSRLAAQMDGGSGLWTSLGWLGWAGIGMTRAREYMEVARARGLKAVTRAEGQQLFSQLISGAPTSAAHVLVTDGEIAYYGLAGPWDVRRSDPPADVAQRAAGRVEHEMSVSLDTHPYLGSHLVRGRPTVPGTFEGEMAARAAKALRPDWHVVEMRDMVLSKFLQLGKQSTIHLRAIAEACGDEGPDLLVRVRLVSDFVHASGRVLEKDRLHLEAVARLAPSAAIESAAPVPLNGHEWPSADPYLSPDAPIRLEGLFRCLHDIRVSETGRTARFRIADTAQLSSIADFLTPAVLLDALFRFSMIHVEPPDTMPLYVPLRCGRTRLVPGINDARTREFFDALRLVAPTPRVDGDRIFSPWARVETDDGRVILAVERMEALRIGEVPRG